MTASVLRLLPAIVALLAAVSGFATLAEAQQFPSKPVRLVVGSDNNSPAGILSRVVAAELAEAEGWRVVVDNRPGASYMISAAEVLKQPADGHTLWGLALPASAAPALLPSTGFRLDADFAPVIKFSTSYNVLVVHPAVPAQSMADLVGHLKANPDKLTFSSGGFGTPAHLIGEMFKLHAGVRATHVPYPGAMTRAVTDLLSGTNQYQFIATLPVVELIAAGRLRALAVTAPKRVPALKDVPTVLEQGFPNLVVEDWVGFAMKSGTPDDAVAAWNAALNRVLARPRVAEVLAKLGAEPAGGTAAAFGSLLSAQVAHWRKVVKDAAIKIEQ
jgi:tripartite-type tricarboxylate transporter receptor subunit TctC